MNRQQIEELAAKLNAPNAPRVFDDSVSDAKPEPSTPVAPAPAVVPAPAVQKVAPAPVAAKPAPATIKFDQLELDKMTPLEKLLLLKLLQDDQEARGAR